MSVNKTSIRIALLIGCAFIFFTSCNPKNDVGSKRFLSIPANQSGIQFNNALQETKELNIFNYLYFYNGGGVAIADFDRDGLQDIYFTANQQKNELYLNKGSFQFEEISEIAGVQGLDGWTTGTTAVDVNADGWMDLYVCMVSDFMGLEGRNLLFLNKGLNEQGIPQFEEQAEAYGLAFSGFSTQAVFFDYDLDHDLDCFLLNHSVHANGTFGQSTKRLESHPTSGDRLYRNDGDSFTDVTAESGIYSSVIGYGLGVVSSDINLDGYPDLYVANDFHEDDYLYINQGDGSFIDVRPEALQHTTRFSMGVDIADFNNDLLPDILSLDMLPEDPVMQKASAAEDPFDVYQFKLNFGYNHQFARNSLQLNRGYGLFSDISMYAGISATDWSWSGIFADFDLDGFKDIMISNGIRRRSNDLDYINYISNETIQYRLGGPLDDSDLALVESLPEVKIPNYAYRYNGNYTFENVSESWGLNAASYSNGTAYADLDNDGDLDLIMNNIDQKAFLYKNESISAGDSSAQFIKITAIGPQTNPRSIGAKIWVFTDHGAQYQEIQAVRGYQSSVEPIAVFGLGKLSEIDSLIVQWPDQRLLRMNEIPVNQQLEVNWNNAKKLDKVFEPHKRNEIASTQLLNPKEAQEVGIEFKHEENNFVEFNREPLIPHMTSREGPAMAKADVNGDGLEDLFLGNSKWKSSELYLQLKNGSFQKKKQKAFQVDSTFEDVDAVFEDIDQDGDLDLIVANGGNEWIDDSPYRTTRLYINDGNGNYERNQSAFPPHYLNASAIVTLDYNSDGLKDFLITARSEPWNYGIYPTSVLLKNEGNAQFSIVDDPALKEFGLVMDAIAHDMDGDNKVELVVAAEWAPIKIYKITETGFQLDPALNSTLQTYYGWWRTVAVSDINEDNKPDLLVGNMGLNTRLKATKDQPVELFVNDFDDNGQVEQILTHYQKGKPYAFATRDEITRQLPDIKKSFQSYKAFAEADLNELFGFEKLKSSHRLKVNELRSGAFISTQVGYQFVPFPDEQQLSAIGAIQELPQNVINNEKQWILSGNFYDINPQMGRYDADYGSVISFDKTSSSFKSIQKVVGLKGQIRKSVMVNTEKDPLLIFGRNDDETLIISLPISK